MLKLGLHTPEGVQDILIEECYIKREIEKKMVGIFKSYGYYEIQPPTFEYYDVFTGKSGLFNQETLFKFFDSRGRILALRPDVTTSIGRIVATKYKDTTLPMRFFYIANAFRFNESYQDTRLKEFTQAGIELIGDNNPEADAEVIAITVNALLNAGLKEFKIEIGQVEFFKGIVEEIKLENNVIEKLRLLIDKKDTVGIKQLLEGYNVNSEIKEVILNLPSLFGDISVIDRVKKVNLNVKSLNALENLKMVYNVLLDYGLKEYISVDLGLVQSINYYTGIIFKGFTNGVGFPVCAGGRYDKLINEFGKDMPATGVAIGVNRVMAALENQNTKFDLYKIDCLINYNENGRKNAFLIADALRRQGLIVQMNLNINQNIIEYAKSKKIDGIVTIIDDENIQLHNLITDEKVKTTKSELLNKS